LRFAHVDEAGTSRDEPYCVVAGVVSHADHQWRVLNEHLSELADEFVPAEDREGIVFHAKDIWHGAKRFPRERWPMEKRRALLAELASMPEKFALPVVHGLVEKAMHKWGDTKAGSAEFEAKSYSLAFGMCAVNVEYVVREMCGENEVAMLVAEDAPAMRRHAQGGFKILSDPKHKWQVTDGIRNYFPLVKVIEQPLFAAKDESSILQISDTIAFILTRKINKKGDVDDLFKLFAGQIAFLPHQRP
jgi:Protein of unknown function (DUF3800)